MDLSSKSSNPYTSQGVALKLTAFIVAWSFPLRLLTHYLVSLSLDEFAQANLALNSDTRTLAQSHILTSPHTSNQDALLEYFHHSTANNFTCCSKQPMHYWS